MIDKCIYCGAELYETLTHRTDCIEVLLLLAKKTLNLREYCKLMGWRKKRGRSL